MTTGSDDTRDPADAAAPAPAPAPVQEPAGGIPRVVIVGRPNVGKSTLFNAMAGRRVAIEDPMAGVTRDRIGFVLDREGCSIELIDTGGIGVVDAARPADEIELQIDAALDLADVVLFLIDAKQGVVPADRTIAGRLRSLGRKVIVVANKVESVKDESGAGEADGFGFGEALRISAKERSNVTTVIETVFEGLGERARRPLMVRPSVRLAIVGRMNVGKSTLVNALVGESRVIVSDVPGTTRDAVDVPFTVGGRAFTAIDTAGMRKGRSVADSVEFYGQARAEKAVRRADVVLLLLDATREIGKIDKQIASQIEEAAVPAIMVVTKWDLVAERADTAAYEEYLRDHIRGLPFAPIAFISAKQGKNLTQTLELAADLYEQAGRRVGTGELNRVLRRAYERRKPRAKFGKLGRIYYASQVETCPPTFVIFGDEPASFDAAGRRYLVHELQGALPFPEIPLRVRYQPRGQGRDARASRRGDR